MKVTLSKLEKSPLVKQLEKTTDIKLHMFKNGDIIEVHFKNKRYPLFINTNTSAYTLNTNKINRVLVKKPVFNDPGNRKLIKYSVNGKMTSSFSARFIAILYELYNNGPIHQDIDSLDVNHIDGSGNIERYGYINEKTYNLEITNESDNKRHIKILERLERLYPGKHFGVSANDQYVMDYLTMNSDKSVKMAIHSNLWETEIDEHGTIFLGDAAYKLREYNRLHNFIN